MGAAIATGKPEKIFYIIYRRDEELIEEKAGRRFRSHDPSQSFKNRDKNELKEKAFLTKHEG